MSFERKQNDQTTEVSISYQSFHKYILNKHRLEILKLTLPTATTTLAALRKQTIAFVY